VTERTLTQRDLNRALLARQLLLERGRGTLPKTLERVGGIQAQYAPSMYVGLWSRLEGFERAQLDRALERRSVVQGTLMRSTIHLVSARDYWPLALAVRAARREQYLRSRRDVSAKRVAGAARRLRAALAAAPRSRAEIDALLGGPGPTLINGLGLWLDQVRVPPAGTWERRRADVYAAAEDWIGPPEVSETAGRELLVRRYLAGFGPASRRDMAGFTGLALDAIATALDRMRLRRFRDEEEAELLDLPRAPLPDPETPAPVRFLPVWDSTLLVHARRTGILPDEYRPRVFNARTPHSVNTFLVDGAVAGTWRHEKGRIRVDPFRRLDRAVRGELDSEAERLASLHE
jgi:hypothetical protein